MNITILGTRGQVPPSAALHENHSGILINQELLIDVGEASYLDYHPKAVLFTHFHPDHAFFVLSQESFNLQVPVYGPEKHALIPQVQEVPKTFKFKDYQITSYPVIHALKLKSVAYLIEQAGKKILVTGDVAWIEKEQISLLPKLDLVITEATFIEPGGRINRRKDRIFGHTGIPNLIKMFRSHTNSIAFVHYGNWFFEDVEQSKEKIRTLDPDMELIPTHDGMQIRV